MVRVILAIVILTLCFVAGAMIIYVINRIRKKNNKKPWLPVVSFLSTIGLGLLIMLTVSFIYLSFYYHADAETAEYLVSDEAVEVKKIAHGYLFDGAGTDTAMIFYPGGKVQTESYAPMLHHLAEDGIDVFLMDMPFHMAIFGKNRADEVFSRYSYENWYISGHSLGAMVAADYASEHPGELKGLVLLAGYPIKRQPWDMELLSIYGTRDTCMDPDLYEKTKEEWPENGSEYVIEGGNHAQYGNYGSQRGDSEAGISAEEQQNLTVERIEELIHGSLAA